MIKSVAGKSLILTLLLCAFSIPTWSQDTLVSVVHSLFNIEDGTIDVFCEVKDPQWVHKLTYEKEKITIDIQADAVGVEFNSMLAQKVLPLKFYGADFQPDPIPPKRIAILWDLGICSQSGAETQAMRTIDRLINSRMLGYSPVTLFMFDTICQYIIPEVTPKSISLIRELIQNNERPCRVSNWQEALEKQNLDKFDIFILLTDGRVEPNSNLSGSDSTWMTFLTHAIPAQNGIYPIGVGQHIDTTSFEHLVQFTQANDEWTSGGRIPITLAQSTIGLDDQNAQIVIQCLPDAMSGLDLQPFSFSPTGLSILFDDQILATSIMNPGTFLRPAILNHPQSSLNRFLYVLMLATTFLAVLILILPMRFRYIFKRDYVSTYQRSAEDPQAIDPLTLVPIDQNEPIVTFGDQIMTLETWKTVKEQPNHPIVKEYPEFFERKYTGYFLGFYTKGFHPIQTAWFGLTGGTVAWVIHEVMYVQPFYLMNEIQRLLIESGADSWLIEFPLAVWTSISLTIGIMGVSVFLRYRRYSLTKLPLFTFVLFVFTYIIALAIVNTMSLGAMAGAGLFWLFTGLVFALSYSIAYQESFLKYVPDALILAIGGFIFFQMISYFLMLKTLNVDLRFASLVAFALFGWLYAQLSVRETIIHTMTAGGENNRDFLQHSEESIAHVRPAEDLVL